MAASQNGFCSYKLSIHKKINIMQIMTKNITIYIFLNFYHTEMVKLDNFMTFFYIIFVCKGRVPDPTSLFPPDLILYVNLVAKGAPKFFKTLAPRLTVLDTPYFADAYSRTVRPIDLHNCRARGISMVNP